MSINQRIFLVFSIFGIVSIFCFQNFSYPPSRPAENGTVFLSKFLGTAMISSVNAKGNPLPQTLAAIPSYADGKKNYNDGYVIAAPDKTTYGAVNGVPVEVGANAIIVVPPGDNQDYIDVTFSGLNAVVSPTAVYALHFKVGLRPDAPAGTRVTIQSITVSGTTSDNNYPAGQSPLAPSEVISGKWSVGTGTVSDVWLPLGLYSRFPDFQIKIRISKFFNAPNNFYNGLVFDEISLWKKPDLQLSVNLPHLSWYNNQPSLQAELVQAASQIHSSYFRTNMIYGNSLGLSQLLEAQKSITNNGQKLLIIVSPQASDTLPVGSTATPPPNANAGPAFNARCSFTGGSIPFSMVQASSLASRLTQYLEAAVSAGVPVDAFEIGNEFSQVCFNGDIPVSTVQAQNSGQTVDGQTVDGPARLAIMQAYAAFLDTAVHTIHTYYPKALIVSGGLTITGADAGQTNPAGYIPDPGQFLSILNQIYDANGKSYYSYFDRIGIHLYPGSSGGVFALPGSLLQKFSQELAGLPQKYFWVTEGGYTFYADTCYSAPSSPSCAAIQSGGALNSLSQQRYESWVGYINSLLMLRNGTVENMIFYELYDPTPGGWSLMNSTTDSSGNLSVSPQAEAIQFFNNYRPQSVFSK